MHTTLLSGVLRARFPLAVGLVVALAACSASPTTVAVPTASVSEDRAADIAPRWNAFARTLIGFLGER